MNGVEDQATATTRRLLALLTPLAVVVVTYLAFRDSFQHEFVLWDDDRMLLHSKRWRGLESGRLAWMFTTFHMGHYQPLAWLSLAIDHRLFGLDPGAIHRTSVLWHCLNGLLLYALARKLLPLCQQGLQPAALTLSAGLAALLFAVHPLRVESVVWATERRDVLSGAFFLGALLCYLRAVAVGRLELRSRAWYVAALACALLSLLAKAWGMVLPALFLGLDLWPLRRASTPRAWLRLLIEKLPFLLLALVAAWFAYLAQSQQPLGTQSLAQHGLEARLAQGAHGLFFYPWRTLWPTGLVPIYELPGNLGLRAPLPALAALGAVSLTVLLVVGRRRWPAALLVWLAYGVTILPVLGVLQSGPQLVADRYSYLSCLGFALLVAALVVRSALRLPARAGVPVAGAILLMLGLLFTATRAQVALWHDTETLWRATLERRPESWVAHGNLGNLLLKDGRVSEAREHLERAVALHPAGEDAWYDLGAAQRLQGEPQAALDSYERAASQAAHPGRALREAGLLLVRTGQLEQALRRFRRATRDPWYAAVAHVDAGRTLRRLGRFAEAVAEYRQALEKDAHLEAAHQGLRAAQEGR